MSYSSIYKNVHIITADGQSLTDTRPLSQLIVELTVKETEEKAETVADVIGGRVGCKDVFNEANYKKLVNDALFQAKELLRAEDAPSGEMDVVLAAGWPSVILHEAVGHGLEGDSNRKNLSVYSGKIGQLIASPEVTIIDQGNMEGTRGSIHFDDEGTISQKNVLVENGILKGYMHDTNSSSAMGVKPTGNGRRQNYKYVPIPRMTNTYIANGKHNPEDIIKSVKYGLYVADMTGGSVDITSGRFNMNASLSYIIRNGKLCEPVKKASIIGDGLQVIQNTVMVGNDLQINNARGICGKDGQSVIVGNGQPTILVKGLTIGGAKR